MQTNTLIHTYLFISICTHLYTYYNPQIYTSNSNLTPQGLFQPFSFPELQLLSLTVGKLALIIHTIYSTVKLYHGFKSQLYNKVYSEKCCSFQPYYPFPALFFPPYSHQQPESNHAHSLLVNLSCIIPFAQMSRYVFFHSLFSYLKCSILQILFLYFAFFFLCLTIYPGNPSISVCRYFPYSCLQLHIMQYSTVWMYCSFFNYCPMYGHLDCLQYSAITMLQ